MFQRLILGAIIFLAACVPIPQAASVELTPTPDVIATPAFSSDPFNDGLIARRNGDYARARAAFQRALDSNPAPDLATDARFRLAEADWLNRDYARAVPAFSAFLQQNPNSPRVNSIHYFLADAYLRLKDYPNALAEYQIFRAQTPTLVGDTDGAIADVLVLAGDSDAALKQYERALQDATLAPLTKFNILIRYADVHQGRGESALAAQKYDAALAFAPDAKNKADILLKAGEAYAAANQLENAFARWNSAINQTPEQPSAYKALVDLVNRGATVDDFQRGLVDYHAAQYDAAIAAFERELKSDQARAGDAHYYLGSSYARKSAPAQAIAEFDFIIKNLSKDKRVADAYLGKIAAYVAQNRTDDAVTVAKKFAAAVAEDARADDALVRAGQILDRAQRYRDAAELYELAQTKYSTRESAPEAMFAAGLDYYRLKEYKTAQARWQTLAQNFPKSNYYTRALYWAGKAAQARQLDADAKKFWTQASAFVNDVNATGMRSYYAWRARDALNGIPAVVSASVYDSARYVMDAATDRAEFEKWLGAWNKGAVVSSLDAAVKNDLRFKRGAELLSLDRTVEARYQFTALLAAKQDDALALYPLALYWQANNQYRVALDAAERIAQLAADARAPEPPRFLKMQLYPADYADLVIAETRANKIDPRLYLALIHHESKFNPWATADAGERGLGQIIPPTARGIAQSLQIKDFDPDSLFLPYVNVRFGVWYFAQAVKQYSDPIYALAAYNAGASRVEKWKRADADLALEEFEIASTALYVRVIYSDWKQYQELYR